MSVGEKGRRENYGELTSIDPARPQVINSKIMPLGCGESNKPHGSHPGIIKLPKRRKRNILLNPNNRTSRCFQRGTYHSEPPMRIFCLFTFAVCFVLMCSPPSAVAQSIKVKAAPTYQRASAAKPVAKQEPAPPPTPDPGPPVTNYTKPDGTNPYAAPVTNGSGSRNTFGAPVFGTPSVRGSVNEPLPQPAPTGRPPAPLPPLSGVLPNKPLFAPPGSGSERHSFRDVPTIQRANPGSVPITPQPSPAGVPPALSSGPATTWNDHQPPTIEPLATDYFPGNSEYLVGEPELSGPNFAAGPESGATLHRSTPAWSGRRRPGTGFLRVNTPLSSYLLDFQNRQTDKEIAILQDAQGKWAGPSLTLGGQLRGSLLYGRTNVEDRFPFPGRVPTDFIGNTATDALLQANTSTVFHAAPWAHGYLETSFSDVFSFAASDQDSFRVREAYAVLGNQDITPLYAFIGRKTVPFGNFGTLSPFTQSVPFQYFAALAEGVGVGYANKGLSAQVMGINGGRGVRVVDSEEIGHINNFAANIRYDWEVTPDFAVGIGGGYLHGTLYDTAVPQITDPTSLGERNGAWDVNGSVRLGSLSLNGELAQTENPWPATNRRVTAWQAEAAYDFLYGDTPCVFSGSFSEGNQGASGTEFEFNRQIVVGLKVQPSPNAFFTVEYVRSTGFAPFIDIATESDRDAIQDSLVLGVVLAI